MSKQVSLVDFVKSWLVDDATDGAVVELWNAYAQARVPEKKVYHRTEATPALLDPTAEFYMVAGGEVCGFTFATEGNSPIDFGALSAWLVKNEHADISDVVAAWETQKGLVRKVTIPVKFLIWETVYRLADYGDHIIVTLPCTAYNRRLGEESLSSYTEKVTDEKILPFLRKIMDNEAIALFSKNAMCCFSMVEIIAGIPLAYDWEVDDFH